MLLVHKYIVSVDTACHISHREFCKIILKIKITRRSSRYHSTNSLYAHSNPMTLSRYRVNSHTHTRVYTTNDRLNVCQSGIMCVYTLALVCVDNDRVYNTCEV